MRTGSATTVLLALCALGVEAKKPTIRLELKVFRKTAKNCSSTAFSPVISVKYENTCEEGQCCGSWSVPNCDTSKIFPQDPLTKRELGNDGKYHDVPFGWGVCFGQVAFIKRNTTDSSFPHDGAFGVPKTTSCAEGGYLQLFAGSCSPNSKHLIVPFYSAPFLARENSTTAPSATVSQSYLDSYASNGVCSHDSWPKVARNWPFSTGPWGWQYYSSGNHVEWGALGPVRQQCIQLDDSPDAFVNTNWFILLLSLVGFGGLTAVSFIAVHKGGILCWRKTRSTDRDFTEMRS
jgi:hypothetical protein